jgi:hypothetical protein
MPHDRLIDITKGEKSENYRKYEPSCKSYWNNEMHFGKTNGTMPQVHSRYFCCSTIAISNNGMHGGIGERRKLGIIVEVRPTIVSEQMMMNGTSSWCATSVMTTLSPSALP